MSQSNNFIDFLRRYGPIPASDNMYDELIQAEIDRHGIEPAIHLHPARLKEVQQNFESGTPRNVILTGTAGDGKTYHCRRIWKHFGGDMEHWKAGRKIVSLTLPESGKRLFIVKDLSELTQNEKDDMLSDLTKAVSGTDDEKCYLVAANDGQLLASWRDWADAHGQNVQRVFKTVEDLLVEDRISDDSLNLDLYNLSRLDASEHFQELVDQIVEHPLWSRCEGCDQLSEDGTTACPILINRDRLRGNAQNSVFRKRLGALMKLARANRMHLPIRDLLLLAVNIILGDRQGQRTLLTCRTARNRAAKNEYRLTNPYANVFGGNLPERKRRQYQVFATLEAFGIGRETDNKFDNLLIYGAYDDSEQFQKLVSTDSFYGAKAYKPFLQDYLEGERKNFGEFMHALSRQRQRLFFTLEIESELDPWQLTVFQASGLFLEFVDDLQNNKDVSRTTEILVQGLNRTFCGMMIDDGTTLYLASSGGDGRGRIAALLNYRLPAARQRRDPYLEFCMSGDAATPCIHIVDPVSPDEEIIDNFPLQLTHFEYLVRVANGSLPASFSTQCREDFLDFKLRLIKRLNERIGEAPSGSEVNLQVLTVNEHGQAQPDTIRIRVDP